MHHLKIELNLAWGEPISAEYLAGVGIRVADCPSGWCIVIPGERPDLAEEISPGCTSGKEPHLHQGIRFWLLNVTGPESQRPTHLH